MHMAEQLMPLMAERAVHIEHRRRNVRSAVAAIEAHAADRRARRDRRVPTGVSQLRVGAGLWISGLSTLPDLVVSRPRPGQVPAVDRRRPGVLDRDRRAETDVPDRKSTRLNSSHLVISYAV